IFKLADNSEIVRIINVSVLNNYSSFINVEYFPNNTIDFNDYSEWSLSIKLLDQFNESIKNGNLELSLQIIGFNFTETKTYLLISDNNGSCYISIKLDKPAVYIATLSFHGEGYLDSSKVISLQVNYPHEEPNYTQSVITLIFMIGILGILNIKWITNQIKAGGLRRE
ncbi:MAG: hypothetical protein ACTSU2_09160, partial [Promethearchaeota archaeon]